MSVERRDFDKLNRKKVLVEEEILNKLQDQLTNDSTAKYVHKLMQRCREKNKETVSDTFSQILCNDRLFSLFKKTGNSSDKQREFLKQTTNGHRNPKNHQ